MDCLVRVRSGLGLALFTDWSVLTKSSVQPESTQWWSMAKASNCSIIWSTGMYIKSSQVKGGVQVSIGKSNNEGHYKV